MARSNIENQDLRLGLLVSGGVHAFLLLALAIKGLFFPSEPFRLEPALRVDLVGLPDILKKDLSQVPKEIPKASTLTPAPAPPKKAAPDLTDGMALKTKTKPTPKNPQAAKAALEKIKALQALNKITEQVENEQEIARESALEIKGNRISKGASLSSEAREAMEASYFDLVRDRLQENWALPVWLARQNHQAQVQLFLDSRGKVKRLLLVKPSGNQNFDEAIRKSIEESEPFPLPPKALQEALATQGILVGFPL